MKYVTWTKLYLVKTCYLVNYVEQKKNDLLSDLKAYVKLFFLIFMSVYTIFVHNVYNAFLVASCFNIGQDVSSNQDHFLIEQ